MNRKGGDGHAGGFPFPKSLISLLAYLLSLTGWLSFFPHFRSAQLFDPTLLADPPTPKVNLFPSPFLDSPIHFISIQFNSIPPYPCFIVLLCFDVVPLASESVSLLQFFVFTSLPVPDLSFFSRNASFDFMLFFDFPGINSTSSFSFKSCFSHCYYLRTKLTCEFSFSY